MEFLHPLNICVFHIKKTQQFKWKHKKAYEIQNATP